MVCTAILYFEVWPRLVCIFGKRKSRQLRVCEVFIHIHRNTVDQRSERNKVGRLGDPRGDAWNDQGLVAVADDRADAFDCCKFLRSALRIAPSHDDLCLRIAAMDAADKGARPAVGFGSHAAGVYNDYVCRGKICRRMKPAMA